MAAKKSEKAKQSEARDRVDKEPAEESKDKPPARDTPSALALEKVGPGPEPDEDGNLDAEAALAHGEAYQAEKKKHRWG